VQAEVAQALAGITGRFRDATGELRGMTAAIQRELEETRAELRRGVLELPQETEASTAEMRRVVAEQIKALNELTTLVARSNRAVDVSLPSARRVNEAPVGLRESRPAPSRPAPEPLPRPEPTPEPPPPAPVRPVTRPVGEAPREGDGRSGWMSDLLSRASREERAPEPDARPANRARGTIESLDTISGDIARMVDHGAVVEAWERWRQGERGLFTAALYTPQGLQTFEEIRRKYRLEPEFKRTVDRYVEEFERLLSEVGRNDRDQALTRTYLTSDTGKVYTLLAHASGRFEE
jgi:hypothetical protein